MFRLLTTVAPRSVNVLSSARLIQRSCPAHIRLITAASTHLLPTCNPITQHTATRSFATRQPQKQEEEKDEEDEDYEPVPFPEARASLAKSLAEDAASLETSNEWTTNYIKDTKFVVKVNLENEGVVATRTVEGHNLRVTFKASDYTEADRTNQEDGDENEDEDVMDEQLFFVDITNPQGKVIRLDCTNASDGELVIHSISFPSTLPPDATTLPVGKESEDTPGGLDFSLLNETSQENALDYLEGLNVDDDLALFVANQAYIVRQQKLAADFTALKKFVQ